MNNGCERPTVEAPQWESLLVPLIVPVQEIVGSNPMTRSTDATKASWWYTLVSVVLGSS